MASAVMGSLAAVLSGLCARAENVGKPAGVQRGKGLDVVADIEALIGPLDKERPVLLAGPTASGKSALALRIAEQIGGPVINADAIQVYGDWRILKELFDGVNVQMKIKGSNTRVWGLRIPDLDKDEPMVRAEIPEEEF